MLNIYIEDNEIIVTGFEDLESFQLTNLKFLGFKKNIQGFLSANLNINNNLLVELVEYLEYESVNFKTCSRSEIILKKNEAENSAFANIKSKASQYKDGVFDTGLFNEFNVFLKKNIKRKLKDHQIKSAYHLYLLGNGANFSVPGSGKTSVILSVFEKLKNEGKVNLLFVIGPLSCFGPWKKEFKITLGREPRYKILAGGGYEARRSNYYIDSNNANELYLTSFQTFLYDKNEVKVLFQQKDINVFLVIDEAHYIKKIDGEWANAILEVAKLATFRAVLTGTPLPKSYTDSYNLFDFLWPDFEVISQENKFKIKANEEKGNILLSKEILKNEISPFFYRVRKSDLNLTPQEFLSPEVITMNPVEREIYDAIFTKIKNFPKVKYFQNIDFIAKLYKSRIMRLRQATSYTKLLLKVNESADNLYIDSDLYYKIKNYDELEIPAKIQALLILVGKLQSKKKKVVIWSNFIETLFLIERQIKKAGFNCKIIFGGVPSEKSELNDEETREKIRDEFVDIDSGLDILIANPAACAESISLHTTCQQAIYYDLSYNCAQYLQSLDRIHRVGGSEDLISYYHYLQYSDTIDFDIKTNLELKKERMLSMIEDEYSIYSLDILEEDEELEAYNRLFNKL